MDGNSREEKIEGAIIHLSKKEIVLPKAQSETFRANVFFMIQQMEGWYLSQPEIIEACLSKYKIGNDLLKDDPKIAGIQVDTIKDPAFVLKNLIGRFFERENKKKLKYHKVQHAAIFLENLDTNTLKKDFQDFRNLIDKMQRIQFEEK